MPVRSFNSRVLRWPGRAEVDRAVRALAGRLGAAHPELLQLGYFGSYARGDFGPGSDVDLVAIVRRAPRPFHERALEFDVMGLPVPAQLLVYTEDEWRNGRATPGGFLPMVDREAVWVYP